ncbi:hypothetical protein FA95DRAFT_505829 [Auriscalpium vulgare]|uniref:Uncharacterized protein n=1 Tax=Auriscalpium vulgare TaxID=40419 RepID=A0ACB8RGC8_9AGAM|nr:hypothetical protein FA95DRAFT_505829 [Auriscalpium vulgare]
MFCLRVRSCRRSALYHCCHAVLHAFACGEVRPLVHRMSKFGEHVVKAGELHKVADIHPADCCEHPGCLVLDSPPILGAHKVPLVITC